ncbi:MAG TPA: hypothetical protein VFU87_02590 [Sphingomicrobium sp.]|nr:hypothetical protein [Sphingomicrobium sp.]
MANISDAAKAEELTKRRSRALPALAVVLLAQQVAYLSGAGAGGGDRTVDHVQAAAWLVLSMVLLLALATGGGWVYSRRVRDLANDEATRAHQADAFRVGFIVAMTAAVALYVVTLFEPLGGRDAVHVILSLGIASALLRFGTLERRAQRDD